MINLAFWEAVLREHLYQQLNLKYFDQALFKSILKTKGTKTTMSNCNCNCQCHQANQPPKTKKFWIVKRLPKDGDKYMPGGKDCSYQNTIYGSLASATKMAENLASQNNEPFCVMEVVAAFLRERPTVSGMEIVD